MRFLLAAAMLALSAACSTNFAKTTSSLNAERWIGEDPAALDQPERLLAMLDEAPPAARGELLGRIGEDAAMRQDLAAVSRRVAALSPEDRRVFLDGFFRASIWPQDDPAVRVARERLLAGRPVPEALHEGILERYTRDHAADPDEIMSFAAQWSQRTGRSPAPSVGIGLLGTYATELRRALAAMAALPEPWQPELFMRAGMRVGAGGDPIEANVRAMAQLVPEGSRCAFVHGAVRGNATFRDLEQAIALADRLDDACPREAWSAVGWAAYATFPYDSAAMEAMVGAFGEAERGAMLEGYRARAAGAPAFSGGGG